MLALVHVSICEICSPRHPRSCLEVLWISWATRLLSLRVCQQKVTHGANFFNSKGSKRRLQLIRASLGVNVISVQWLLTNLWPVWLPGVGSCLLHMSQQNWFAPLLCTSERSFWRWVPRKTGPKLAKALSYRPYLSSWLKMCKSALRPKSSKSASSNDMPSVATWRVCTTDWPSNK